MATVNESLRDEAIAHSVWISRYATGVANRMVKLLNETDSELSARLLDALDRLPADSFTVTRLESLLGSVRELNHQAVASMQSGLEGELLALCRNEVSYQLSLFDSLLPSQMLARYPNTALLYIEFDSSQFNGSIPQIACEPRGRVIRVPDTYDPETRTYSGTWLGTFKWAWTDNPAWIFYDLVVSDRFGLGDRLTTANIDKWTLYQVAQYCDQMVPDGKGGSGTEPRYTCNVYIQERNDAYTVLRDFAAIFRGMTYWGDDQIVALADMPRDVDFTYTHANVIDGRFTYSSSTTKNRYTNALVSWSDPDNAYSDAMEPVFEQALVSRYGFNQLEITAIGCTRQSEANRKGRWGILTNNKDRVVTFNVGEDGNIPQPGYVIAVADRNLSGRDLGGRVSVVNGRVLTLDRAPDASSGDRMIVNLPSGVAQSRTIQTITGNKVTVTTAYSETPVAQAVWVIESDELYAQQYRVITVTDNNDGTFTIVGANHDPDKYARIDGGFDIPTDRNKQPLIWLDYEVSADGSVLVKTFHREYPSAPIFARNAREGFVDGEPADIPADQFVSVRVEMPQNSIWNQRAAMADVPDSSSD